VTPEPFRHRQLPHALSSSENITLSSGSTSAGTNTNVEGVTQEILQGLPNRPEVLPNRQPAFELTSPTLGPTIPTSGPIHRHAEPTVPSDVPQKVVGKKYRHLKLISVGLD